MMIARHVRAARRLGGLLLLAGLLPAVAQTPAPPVVVKFHEPRVEATQSTTPVDPKVRIAVQHTGNMAFGLTVDQNVMLCCGAGAIRTNFKIDERVIYPPTPGPGTPLPPGPNGKPRHGTQQSCTVSNVHITQIIEVIPSKPAKSGEKRALDTVLIRYVIENKDNVPHKVGTRVRIDTLCKNNDGALFAAPQKQPGKVLNGFELKGKDLPDFVQILERPNLENPGFVGHFTLNLGKKFLGPDRFVGTIHGAAEQNNWDVAVQPANGDSDCALFWEPRTVPPGGKIEMAYAYGKGLASLPENEGRLSLAFGGSFEPNKLFTITALVDDPLPHQALTLDLPAGLERVEGREVQPVPPPSPGSGTSMVLWKGRVRDVGDYTIRVRSSNGVTQTRRITISRPLPRFGE